MDVSIIIVNYKTYELTFKTIESILNKTQEVSYEIIVIDNYSNDNSIEKIEIDFGNKINAIKLDNNLGFGKANNFASKFAKGEYLFFLNSDTILVNNAIKYLHEFMIKDKNIGAAGGNLFDKEMNPIHSYKLNIPRWIYILFHPIRYKFMKKMYIRSEHNFDSVNKEVGYITGADLMIEKRVFDKLKGFDNDFFMYYEDAELQYRIKKTGLKIYSVPKAKIIHLVSSSTKSKDKTNNLVSYTMNIESRYIYFSKLYGIKSLFLVYLINIFWASWSLMKQNQVKVKFKICKDYYLKIKKQY